jgi:ABC-type lipoprotein export system ATPase subunit/bifunctional DNA-binding transcriptional regulator/antitoxin component of YhaV-PrlF toxin-antitoxin module
MNSQEPFIICDNLVKIFKVSDHDVMALQGLDLIVNRGEMLGIVGVSGSGKSTLMNILGGLDRPSAGRLRVGGRDLLKISRAELDGYRLATVGIVWQHSGRNLVPYLNGLENVELPLTLAGYDGPKKRSRAQELLDAVGVAARGYHSVSELSGGEQQRLSIAVALANDPRLLLADEPTGNVDEANALMIYQIFKDLNRQYNLTTLIVSHDPNLAQHVDRVVAIRDGKITSEKIWQFTADGAEVDPGLTAHEMNPGMYIHELTVLDSAGRLQIPKEYLERHQIKGRVELEITEEGILVRPAHQADPSQASTHAGGLSAEDLVTALDDIRKVGRWRRMADQVLSRFRK